MAVSVSILNADPVTHAPVILEMLKELTEFEKMPLDSVKMTAARLQNDLEAGHCHCFVAAQEGVIVGYLLYYYGYSTWEGRFLYMEDIYVRLGYRRLGVGKALFNRAVKIAADQKLSRLEWAVLDWNRPAIDFYEKFGGEDIGKSEGWLRYRLPEHKIHQLTKQEANSA